MATLRILQVHTYLRSEKVNPRSGGKSRASLMLSRYLLDHGHEVAVYSWPERIWGDAVPFATGAEKPALALPTLTVPPITRLGVDLFRLRRTRFPGRSNRSIWIDLCFAAGLRAAIHKFKPDILHCHQTDSDVPALLGMLGRPVPAILTHHSGKSGPQLNAYNRILFISRTMQMEICERIDYLRENTAVTYCPILPIFQEGTILSASRRRGVVCVGVLTKAKGVDLLLEAYRASASLRMHPLTLCGAGEDEEEFRRFVKHYSLPVHFAGRVNPFEVRKILSSAKILVNPSRMEGFSIALLESLACGTPFIGWASQVAELEGWWQQRVGYPFDARSQSALDLVKILSCALDDPLWTSSVRAGLAKRARESFSIERFGLENIHQYHLLLDGQCRG